MSAARLADDVGVCTFVIAHDKIEDDLDDVAHILTFLKLSVVGIRHQILFELLDVFKGGDLIVFHALHQSPVPVF